MMLTRRNLLGSLLAAPLACLWPKAKAKKQFAATWKVETIDCTTLDEEYARFFTRSRLTVYYARNSAGELVPIDVEQPELVNQTCLGVKLVANN